MEVIIVVKYLEESSDSLEWFCRFAFREGEEGWTIRLALEFESIMERKSSFLKCLKPSGRLEITRPNAAWISPEIESNSMSRI